jgi:glycosyltransferase involved in cell wall biosynthesis
MSISNKNQTAVPVSVALCTFNGEKFLEEQLESVLNQDYKSINEIICVDDNSSDKTWEILCKYAEKYPIFKITQNKTNLGFIKNFEKAITMTSNLFIAISDQDDIWYPNKISKLVDKIGDSLMVYSDNEYIDSKGNKLGVRFSEKRNLVETSSCLNFALFNAISGHTILFKRELLTFALPFPSDIHYDWWLGFHASQYSNIQVVNEILVGYRQHVMNVVGGYGIKKSDKKESKFIILNETHVRLHAFIKVIAPHLTKEKTVLELLEKSYTDKSLKMRLKRIQLFWENRDALFLFKKRSELRKKILCLKAIWRYD